MKARQRIISTILLSSGLTISLAVLLPKPLNRPVLREWFWYNKTFETNELELIVGGDSRVYRGISTDYINRQLKNPMVGANLGYSSAGYSLAYFEFLEKHFRQSAKIKVLILGITPYSFSAESRKNKHLKTYLNKGFIDRWKALYLNPSLNLFEPRRLEDLLAMDSVSYFESYHEDGWMESDEIPGDSLKALKSYEHLFDDDGTMNQAADIFMLSIKKLREQGVIIIGFRPPTTPQMRVLEDNKSSYDEVSISQRFKLAGGVWLELKDEDFATYDGSHLRPAAATKLSIEIGKVLNELIER